MADEFVNDNGEGGGVREDTVKSARGTNWILIVVAIVLIAAAVLFVVFGLGAASGGNMQSPGQIENSSRR